VLARTAVVLDGWLAWQMVARIGAVCLNCLSTYALNLGLVAAFGMLDQASGAKPDWKAWLLGWWPLFVKHPPIEPAAIETTTPSTGAASPPARAGKLVVALAGLAAMIVAFVLTSQSIAATRAEALEEAVEFLTRSHTEPAIDMSQFAGRPSEGPADARVTIVVASDFEGSYCRALAAGSISCAPASPRRARDLPERAHQLAVQSPRHGRFPPHACWLAKANSARPSTASSGSTMTSCIARFRCRK
jgi:hypothetical protein